MRNIIASILTILLLLCGCASADNKQIADTGPVAKIEVGKTTKSEVKALVGEPTIANCRDDNTEVWQYFYNPGNNLSIVFSHYGIVQKVSSLTD